MSIQANQKIKNDDLPNNVEAQETHNSQPTKFSRTFPSLNKLQGLLKKITSAITNAFANLTSWLSNSLFGKSNSTNNQAAQTSATASEDQKETNTEKKQAELPEINRKRLAIFERKSLEGNDRT